MHSFAIKVFAMFTPFLFITKTSNEELNTYKEKDNDEN